ncbi:hypothetical protein NEUTE1DRAFT_49041, partial [Neurospora tetrasperma FGSC 2508]
PNIVRDVNRFVKNYIIYKVNKVPRNKILSNLYSILLSDKKWTSIVINYKKMPKNKYGFNNAPVIVDRLIKLL